MLESQIVVSVGDNISRLCLYSFTFRRSGMQTFFVTCSDCRLTVDYFSSQAGFAVTMM